MSWSLELRNGDLTIGGARLGTVTSTQKLVQDIRCCLLERMGTDDLHPGYGSTLDGGRLPNGREVPGFLGRTDWDHVAVEIDAEIRRIAREHQERQVARTQSDRQTYGKSTLVAGEVLIDLAAVDLRQVQDTLVATIHLRVGNSRVQTINIPLASEPVIAR